MNPGHPVERLRRRLPQTVRVRLAILYAALFFAAGALLLGLTYGLVASSLPRTASISKFTNSQQANLKRACSQGNQAAKSNATSHRPSPPGGQGRPELAPLPSACQKLAAEGANAATTNQRNQTLHNLLLFSLLGLGAMTLASAALGWVMARRVLGPVSTITEAARSASERHLGERVDLQGPNDELKELADTFDAMLERLDVAFANQRRFVADASHELRTPLTVMRTSIDVTMAKPDRSQQQLEVMAAKVRRSVDQAEKLINSLLALAVSEQGPSATEFIDLATVAEDAIDTAGPEIAHLGLQVTTNLDVAELHGDRNLLERLVANLVDNAARHNLPDGWISVRTGTEDKRSYIRITNSGPIIDQQLVASLFEPFRKIEERTATVDGVGLGLAIVRSIATAHDATIDAHSRPEGGLTISVSLPVTRERVPSI